MTFAEWLGDTGQRLREDGLAGAAASVRELYVGGLRRINAVYPRGTNVFDREWELLVVLDACRTDLMAEAADDRPFLDDPGELTSVGSSSLGWLERTFTDEHAAAVGETAYVTGNPFSHQVLDDEPLLALDEVWTYAWDDDLGTIPARPLTDRAIAAGRELDPDRLIVHYMQPHFPSVPDPLSDGMDTDTFGEGWESPWKLLRRGEVDAETVWAAYRANLEYVLDDVALLLENVDADRAVITADHGNAAGEFGVYGHPRVPLSVIRQVPWYETTATDERTRDPDLDPGGDSSDDPGGDSSDDPGGDSSDDPSDDPGDVEDRLSALGYR